MSYERTPQLAVIHRQKVERIFILGDIHGDLDAFRWAVEKITPGDLAVFLGDYTDRGPQGLEVLEALQALTRRFPDRCLALKGNHEDYSDAGEPLFSPCTLMDEVERKGRRWGEFFPEYKSFIDELPLAAIIPGYALLLHGGPPADLQSIEDLKNPSSHARVDLLWSDPGDRTGAHSSPRGAGTVFGPDISRSVLERLGLKILFRGHQPDRASLGPAFDHEARVVTLSCTSAYGGTPFVMVLPADNLPESRDTIAACTEFL